MSGINFWLDKLWAPISKQQALQIVGGQNELNKLMPVFTGRHTSKHNDYVNLGRTQSGSLLIKNKDLYFVVGEPKENDRILDSLKRGEECLMEWQRKSDRGSKPLTNRLELLIKAQGRAKQRLPVPMW